MKSILLVFFVFISTFSFAQQVLVLDYETNKPIKEVTLYNKEKTVSHLTNDKGFTNVSEFKNNEKIIFSHVSYALFTIKKDDLKKLNYKITLTKHSEQLDEVVLSVFKKEEKINRIAEPTQVVLLKDIEKESPQTSADLLSTIPGIKVQKSQFGGGSPVLRGMESNRVLLVVDGVRMNNAIYRKGHLQNAITVAPNLLEKTEVVFGPSSVMYGSDALGGVIHYYTKSPKLADKPTIKTNFFSRFSSVNNEITSTISTEFRLKKWASLTSISYSDFGDLTMGKNRSNNFTNWGKVFYYSENNNNIFKENPTKNTNIELQKNTGFKQTDVLQKFFVPLSTKTDLKINLQYSTSSNIPRFDKLTELKNDTDASSLKFAEWYYGPQNRLLISSQLLINPEKNWLNKGVFTFSYQNVKESRIQRKFGSLERSHREENVNVYSVNGDFSVPITKKNNSILGYGFEFSYNNVGSTSYGKNLVILNNKIVDFLENSKVQSRYPDGGSSYVSTAVYTNYKQNISNKSTINAGVRLTNTQLRAKWIDETFITLPSNTISLQNTAATLTFGYLYKPAVNWQFNAVLSSGFRSPNIDDVGKVSEKKGNVTVPNIHLKPEHAYNAEIGFLKYSNNKRFKIGANIYYTLLNNYIYRDAFTLNKNTTILYDGEEGKMVANQNKGNAYITGFTVNYQGKLHKNWHTSGFITYTKGKTYDTNEPLSSIPPIFGNFQIDYTNHKIDFGANLKFNARKKIADYNLTEGIDNVHQTPIVNTNAENDIDKYYGSPSWATVAIFGKYKVSENWAFQGKITNLFNQYYREFASGISAPGRNFSLSVMANF